MLFDRRYNSSTTQGYNYERCAFWNEVASQKGGADSMYNFCFQTLATSAVDVQGTAQSADWHVNEQKGA